ncbi:CDP-glycerol glycerophosphotransferase family protein [Kangiella aquimarina]|uniref:CDP-glycerol glycerophosphotransferase family protein n=1 Tax=Kangiella aquimarina TaxID=261965 RepID=A0ABZ0X5P7_9GAMM|nr:CDP-glycerol glycerophosphotransferase family protein [Kangiella aquimarina]WQG85721.1 CDP-glycerol glycerophosphotransferase family protein [Kangiella aquimarina]
MKILFDVAYLYYLPHFTPVLEELKERGVELGVVFREEPPANIKHQLEPLAACHVISDNQLINFYDSQSADWIIFGNSSQIPAKLSCSSKTAMIMHGLGPKSAYYNGSNCPIEYRFVESEIRQKTLQKMFPDKVFTVTGYTKLDPLINGTCEPLDLTEKGLIPEKKTILYSPTFFPSTIENFPKDWPEQFADYNILIKPHYLSLIKSAYKKQRELLEHWANYPNVYLAKPEEQSLLPFMATADIMISETSSALFEFMALNKPVIIAHFLKLRIGYWGLLKFRFKKRLSADYKIFNEIGTNINHYHQLKSAVEDNLANPTLFEPQRLSYIEQILGTVDGHCSARVADYLLNQP